MSQLLRSVSATLSASPYRPLYPSFAVLAAVVLFWIVGAFGGLAFLHEPKSPLVTLATLYAIFFLMTASLIAGVLAAVTVARRFKHLRPNAQVLALHDDAGTVGGKVAEDDVAA